MQLTVEVLGVDLVVEFDGTPFEPAKVWGPPEDCYPASGGEADIISVTLDGTEITELLSDWTIARITEQLTEYLCTNQESECFEEPETEVY